MEGGGRWLAPGDGATRLPSDRPHLEDVRRRRLGRDGTRPIGDDAETRRAPYVAIVVWGGPHLNPYIRKTEHVGVASALTGLDQVEHGKMMRITDARVRELLKEPAEDPEWLRRVGFILPTNDCAPLRTLLDSERVSETL